MQTQSIAPVLTILEDVTDADQFIVICGMKSIGTIRRDEDGGFYPVYSTQENFLECGDVASLKEAAAHQLLEYREMELGQTKLYGQPKHESRPNFQITDDGRSIPVSYGKPAPPVKTPMFSSRRQPELVRGIHGYVSID